MKTTKSIIGTKKDKHQIDIWKVVNIDKEDGTITMLDYLFRHDKKFKGATGTKFNAISKAEYKDRTSKESVIDNIISSGLITAPSKNLEYKFAEVMYKEMKANDEIESFCFDLSYIEHWDKLREFGFSKSKYPVFDCVGGGRCFDENFEGNVNPELSKQIREYESK